MVVSRMGRVTMPADKMLHRCQANVGRSGRRRGRLVQGGAHEPQGPERERAEAERVQEVGDWTQPKLTPSDNALYSYAEFVTISKEIATLENDMLELKDLLAEWKAVPQLLGVGVDTASDGDGAKGSVLSGAAESGLRLHEIRLIS